MNKVLLFLTAIIVALFTPSTTFAKEKGEVKLAKVWFKDGSIYEGPLVKHWVTYSQRFTASKHNFHILPEGSDKSVKCQSSQVDSILILSSTHSELNDSAMFVPMIDGRVPMNGPKRKTNKLMRRVKQGRYVDFCTLPYMGNCMRGLKNVDQLLKYWLIRFHDNDEAFVFFSVPIWNGCNKESNYLKYFYDRIKSTRQGLAEAIKEKYFPDKGTDKQGEVLESAQDFVDFIDDYLAKHPE